MPNIERYEIVEELFQTEHGSLSRARLAKASKALFAVKRFGVALEDPSEPNWRQQTFLDRARIQQHLASDGNRHWAQIHDQGMGPGDWAYYVTDYFLLTGRKLIDGRVTLKSQALHAILSGVVRGLSELSLLLNRPHGNLKPENVLIDGIDLAAAHVVLTDPSTNGQAAKNGEAGDLWHLGELIHGLVLHRQSTPGQWPLPTSAQWDALGTSGESWRQLCSDLLNPDPAARPNLILVSEHLHALRTRRRSPFRKIAAIAATLAIVSGSAVAALSAADHASRSQYCMSKWEWFGDFLDAATDPEHRQAWQADPDLHRILSEFPLENLRSIDCDTHPTLRWKYHEYKDVVRANHVVKTLAAELPLHMQKAVQTQKLYSRFHDRGWNQPAAYLAKLLEDATPAPGVNVAAGIDRLLQASPQVEAGMQLADSDWKQFTERLRDVQSLHDPVLTTLAGVLKKSALSEVRLGPGGLTGLDDLKQDMASTGQLAEAIQYTWPTNVDRESFDRDVADSIDLKHPGKQDVAKWLRIVEANAFRRNEAVTASGALRKNLNEAVDRVNHSRINPEEVNTFTMASHDAATAIRNFEATPYTQKKIDDGSFARQIEALHRRIEGLNRFSRPQTPDEWLESLPQIATGSQPINAYWESARKQWRVELPVMAQSSKIFADRRRSSEQLQGLLVSLDESFPPVTPIPNEAFVAAARRRREVSIEELLSKLDLRDPKIGPEMLKSSEDNFSQWMTHLVSLSQDFPISREILAPDAHPDEKWKTTAPEFWNDSAVQALVKNDVTRLNRLAALDTAPREQLIKALTGKSEVEVALKAWRLLGAPGVQPAWPSLPDELGIEVKFRQRLEASFKGLKDPLEAEIPLGELAEQAPVRWRTFVERATSETMMKIAWKLSAEFKIGAEDISRLPAISRYSLDLTRLREAVESNDDNGAREALAGVSRSALELKDQPQAVELSRRIALLGDKEAFADQKPRDVFALTLPGASRPVEFKRVEPAKMRPFYLCATDISVAQFALALNASNAWPQARQLPWPIEIGKGDTRRGPRTWEWGGTASAPLTTPLLWLAPEEFNDFPPPLRTGRFNRMSLSAQVGGNPSPDHPVQYISGKVALFYAGLCGCRLPAASEWQAAYSIYEKDVPMERWNLRDQTWEAQHRYVALSGAGRWPDEGIFPAVPNSENVGRSATSRSENDNTLYFQPISGSGGLVFHHLVGNVAQFVCNAPDVFDRWDDKKTAAGINKFVEAAHNSLYVIGASSLSPPEAPFDKPLPVEQPGEAYADVGLRLAFTAPARTLTERVKWTLGNPEFLWPNSKQESASSH